MGFFSKLFKTGSGKRSFHLFGKDSRSDDYTGMISDDCANIVNDDHEHIFLNSMAKKTVITRVLDIEANEAIVEFPQNRTLMVEQFTDDPPAKAEILKDLRSVDDIFDHFKPKISMEFKGTEGQTAKETLNFQKLKDFEIQGLLEQSGFLKNLRQKKESYLSMEKQLRTNKILRDAVSDPESRDALIKSLQALLKELQQVK